MRAAQSLLLSLLPIVSATTLAGCGDKDGDDTGEGAGNLRDGSACIYVDEDAACPDPSDVDESEMMGSCGSTVVQVTGAGTYEDNVNWWAGDTADQHPGCCYPVRETEPSCVYGRPIKDEAGAAQLAGLVEDPTWAAKVVPADVPEAVRAALIDRWTRAALDEHASVAAFSKVALDLMRFGAPPELLTRCHQAARDEVAHARLGFGVVSAFAGRPVGPGRFPLDRAPLAESMVELAVDAVLEGCLGEGLASLLAAEGARRTTDPVLKKVLTTIARDEAEHARLGWRIVRWALEVGGPEVRLAVAATFQDALERGIAVPEAPESDLSAWGLLSRADAEAMGRLCLREVVAPAAQALLTSTGSSQAIARA